MHITRMLSVAAAAALIASPAIAQKATSHGKMVATAATTRSHARPNQAKRENLEAEAKISRDSARAIALGKVPAGSRIRSTELEREKGTIVYSFDIKVPKRAGVEEVLVSALDGSVVAQSHESPKAERAEARKEKAESRKAKSEDRKEKGEVKKP